MNRWSIRPPKWWPSWLSPETSEPPVCWIDFVTVTERTVVSALEYRADLWLFSAHDVTVVSPVAELSSIRPIEPLSLPTDTENIC